MHRITRNKESRPVAAPPSPEQKDHVIAPLSVRIAMAVKLTGIGRSKLYELIQEGEVEIVKIGSATLIPIASLERLLERHKKC